MRVSGSLLLCPFIAVTCDFNRTLIHPFVCWVCENDAGQVLTLVSQFCSLYTPFPPFGGFLQELHHFDVSLGRSLGSLGIFPLRKQSRCFDEGLYPCNTLSVSHSLPPSLPPAGCCTANERKPHQKISTTTTETTTTTTKLAWNYPTHAQINKSCYRERKEPCFVQCIRIDIL